MFPETMSREVVYDVVFNPYFGIGWIGAYG